MLPLLNTSRNFTALLSIQQLVSEKDLKFRADAVRMGLFLGWFTGGYRALRALARVFLQKYAASHLPPSDMDRVVSLSAGALASTAVLFMDAKRYALIHP